MKDQERNVKRMTRGEENSTTTDLELSEQAEKDLNLMRRDANVTGVAQDFRRK